MLWLSIQDSRLGLIVIMKLCDWRSFARCAAADVLSRAEMGHRRSRMLRPAAQRLLEHGDPAVPDVERESIDLAELSTFLQVAEPDGFPREVFELGDDLASMVAVFAEAQEGKPDGWPEDAREYNAYRGRVIGRVVAGESYYGGISFGRPVLDLMCEIENEAADISGWSWIAATVLQRTALPPDVCEDVTQQLQLAVRDAMTAHARVARARDVILRAVDSAGGAL
jgi:hypothetical protein